MSTPERPELSASPASIAAPPHRVVKSQRILACLLCQQRKVKCDRKFPCANCTKSHSQCVPGSTLVAHQRRRRFPERELLSRLRHYEDLLRKHNISFDPLHSGSSNVEDGNADGEPEEAVVVDPLGASIKAPSMTVNVWRAINGRSPDPNDDSSISSSDDVHETVTKTAWNDFFPSNDHLLFGAREENIDTSALHPDQVQIFRLWQAFIDNINPMLKVIHVPTLQSRIIDAAGKLSSIKPPLAALMFSIYCSSLLSITETECMALFAASRDELMTRFQFGCRQALLDSGFMRSDNRDCLTALFLYLLAIRPGTDPKSLTSMLALALRIAQRMGLHSETACAKHPALEAEMRRRLWWALVLFDTRICEMAGYQTSILSPIWNCKVPLNVNDFELQPEMREPPIVQETSTEALFVVVRSAMAEHVRQCAYHLDFVNPALKPLAKNMPRGKSLDESELASVENMVEEKYLRNLNPENALHFMTIWTARAYLAKAKLYEHFSRVARAPSLQTNALRDDAMMQALCMLECETIIRNSPLIQGYQWYLHIYFPFLAYVHILQDLERRPRSLHSERAWQVMCDNYDACFHTAVLSQMMAFTKSDIPPHIKKMGPPVPRMYSADKSPFFTMFSRIVFRAWKARQESKAGDELPKPRIVSELELRIGKLSPEAQAAVTAQLGDSFEQQPDLSKLMMPWGSMDPGTDPSTGAQGISNLWLGPWQDFPAQPEQPEQPPVNVDLNEMTWNNMDWNSVQGFNW